MSAIKGFADYSPAELLESLVRTEPRFAGDLYSDGTFLFRDGQYLSNARAANYDAVCHAELLRVLVESLRLWQVVACDALNALEGIVESVEERGEIAASNPLVDTGREVLAKYKHLNTGEIAEEEAEARYQRYANGLIDSCESAARRACEAESRESRL